MSSNTQTPSETMIIEEIGVDCYSTHHVRNGQPIYGQRFLKVLKYHPPGLAAVRDASGCYHIWTDGNSAYKSRFAETFGFYEGLAAVQDASGWFHISVEGNAVYSDRYSWVGNFQNGRVPVRDFGGHYFHLDPGGGRVYAESYVYTGDYREGIACVRKMDGLCIHIDLAGKQIHQTACLDLDVFHKGFSRARDDDGWFHMRRDGTPAYKERFAEVEPFYNGQALCRDWIGRRLIVNENGDIIHVVWEA